MPRYCPPRPLRRSSGPASAVRRAFLACLALLLPAWPLRSAELPVVAVPIPPLEWLVRAIAGDTADVVLLVPPGASAEQYDPSPGELLRLADARVFFATDIPVERRWLPTLTRMNDGLRVVALGIPAPQFDWKGERLPGDAPRRAPGQPDLDFHAWNSPAVMIAWIDPIVEVLAAEVPAAAPSLGLRAAAVRDRLRELDQRLRERLAPFAGRVFLTLHPAWGYFARHYGLLQMAIEAQGQEPGARTLSRLVEEARSRGVQQVYVPPRVDDRHVQQIAAALGAETLVADDLAGDYPEALDRFAESLVRGFAP